MHAHLRTLDSSVDAGLTKLGCGNVVEPPSVSSSSTKVIHDDKNIDGKETEGGEDDDETNNIGHLLPRLQAHRIRCAERSVSLLETLRTDLCGIDAEARRRAEESRARHDAELARAVQGGGGAPSSSR